MTLLTVFDESSQHDVGIAALNTDRDRIHQRLSQQRARIQRDSLLGRSSHLVDHIDGSLMETTVRLDREGAEMIRDLSHLFARCQQRSVMFVLLLHRLVSSSKR